MVDLPDFMSRERTCCFTGHRRIAAHRRDNIIAAVDARIMQLYHVGYRCFIAGGALGFDMLAETEVLRAARFDDSIKLILALPCRDQTAQWDGMPDYLEQLRRYKELLGRADHVVYLSDFYTDTCMQERNRFMVEHSSACIAYYSGYVRSGAGQTYRMALSNGLDIYNVWDEVNPIVSE